jgi:hypothetical protein
MRMDDKARKHYTDNGATSITAALKSTRTVEELPKVDGPKELCLAHGT